MNSFQRYTAMIENKPLDIIPRIPVLMHYAAKHIGSSYDKFASDYKTLVEANIACATDFGFDQVSTISDPYRETHGFGAEVEYVKDGVPRCEPPLRDAADFSLLKKPDPLSSERMLDRINAVKLYREKLGDEYSVLGWIEGPAAEAADLRGVSDFLMGLISDPVFCGDLMDLCLETGVAFARAQIEAGADTIGIGDAIASQVSPQIYSELILPREKRLLAAVREAGGYTRLHICGDITHLLPYMTSLPVDIIDVDHMVDLGDVRDKLGKGVVISGNIDPVSGVMEGTPESIRKVMLGTYSKVGNPYMVNAGCEIPQNTPEENLRTLCNPIYWNG